VSICSGDKTGDVRRRDEAPTGIVTVTAAFVTTGDEVVTVMTTVARGDLDQGWQILSGGSILGGSPYLKYPITLSVGVLSGFNVFLLTPSPLPT
jgi:hypothetical protein